MLNLRNEPNLRVSSFHTITCGSGRIEYGNGVGHGDQSIRPSLAHLHCTTLARAAARRLRFLAVVVRSQVSQPAIASRWKLTGYWLTSV
jgi:hypothetical protein